MRKKQNKIQITSPFGTLANNWELMHQIQTSLNKYLADTHLYTNLQPTEETERLGKLSIEQIIKFAKALMQVTQSLRAEQKNIEQIKINAQVANQKLEQHQQIVRNYQRKFSERTKALVDENKMLKEGQDKMKKTYNESQQSFKTTIEEVKAQSQLLRQQIQRIEIENKRLLMTVSKLQQDLKNKDELVYRLKISIDGFDQSPTLKQKVAQLYQIRIQSRKKQQEANAPNFSLSVLQRISLIDITSLANLLSFLTPKQICIMASLNKQIRFFIFKSKTCVFSLAKSVLAVKNRQVAYYHRHIQYFQKLYNKIPEQILQLTYFKYHMLKQTVGSEIMSILNSSAVIFQGKFLQGGEGQQLYSGITQQSQRQIEVKYNTSQSSILQVEPEIVHEYVAERTHQKQKLMKLFESMYNKISSTYQLYRADLETSGLFIDNVLKHFSKVFVLSKNLYFQAQSLQKLNSFLLNQLNKWDRMEIDKNLQLQDLRAELEAQKKLKLFFTDKSIKSQQKALIEQNLKLTYEMKYGKLSDLMNVTCAEKDELHRKYQTISKTNNQLNHQNKQIRRLYEGIREKYNKITEELAVVKQTIIKMNII